MASALTGKSLLSRLTAVPAKYPFYFGVGISCVKTSFSDYLVQKLVERKEKVDWKRNAAFAAFGFFYLGGVQYGIYVQLFGRMFPNAGKFASKPIREKLKDTKGMFNVGAQVCCATTTSLRTRLGCFMLTDQLPFCTSGPS